MGTCAKIKSFSNRGTLDCTQCGSLINLSDLEVHYNLQYITNLISMSEVTSKYCVTTDSGIEYAIVLHFGRNQNIKFNRCGDVLYYFYNDNIGHMKKYQDKITDNDKTDKSKISFTGYSFVSTVIGNK